MTAGRPAKFESVEELQSAISDYFDYCDNRIQQVYSKKSDGVIEIVNPEPYTMAGLALAIGLSRQGLMEYKNKSKEFSDAIKKARDKVHMDVERRLMEGNSTGAIFNLKNNFGWKDKTETDITSGGDKIEPVTVRIIDEPQRNTNTE
jgi:hypothetical protein